MQGRKFTRLWCLSIWTLLAVSAEIGFSSTGPGTTYDDAPTQSGSFQNAFAELNSTSRGLLFPSFDLGLGAATGDGFETTTSTSSSTEDAATESPRGFLTKTIGKFLDKHGNELTELCYRDSMCADNVDGRTACYRGRCVECTSSASCTDPSRPVCDLLSRTCVQCTSTSQCSSGVCSPGHVCVECTSNSRCAGRGTYIDFICSTYAGNERELLLMNTCAECVVNSDCPYRMVCGSDNTCQCSSDAHCDSPQPYCSNGRCQECVGSSVGSSDGSSVEGSSVCSDLFGGGGRCLLKGPMSEVYRCVECMDSSDCGGAACVDGSCSCVSNGCADGMYCDKATQRCVGCLRDSDCTSNEAPYCSEDGECVQCTGESVSCRKETTVGTVVCNGEFGTCEPMCDGSDEDCLSETRPYCDAVTGHCTSCRNDQDCENIDPLAPFCMSGEVNGVPMVPRCVQCLEDGQCESGLVCNHQNLCSSCSTSDDCPSDRPLCSPDVRTCVACDDEAGLFCPKERPICAAGQCLGCEYDSDCGSVLKCDQETNRCELCLAHEDCAAIYGDSRPFCSYPHGTCLECRGSKDCSEQFPVCSNGVCVQCTTDMECEEAGICDVASGVCVECMDNSQCWNALPYCRGGRCAQCLDDSQCRNGTTCINGVCKECDGSTSTVCTTIVQKQYQTCTSGLTCESNVAVGSLVARVVDVEGGDTVVESRG